VTSSSTARRQLTEADSVKAQSTVALQSKNDLHYRWWLCDCVRPPFEVKRNGGKFNVGTGFETPKKKGWYFTGRLLGDFPLIASPHTPSMTTA
jgi:hypothetical protein